MPSVYTIEGASPRRRRRRTKTTRAQYAAQNRMKRAAKKCKGLKKGAFKACMRRELKKR